MSLDELRRAADYLAENGAEGARVGLVLGSGLGAFGERVEDAVVVPYGDIPGFPTSAVAGHKGQLVAGTVGGVKVAVLQGRVHRYEGWGWDKVVFPVRALAALGVRAVVLTNAAGGIDPAFAVGDLMRIVDHLNLMGGNPLVGPHDPDLGPRFPDMSEAWNHGVGQAIDEAALKVGISLRHGLYAALLGPSYETPAEIRMFRTLGADAIGMSTVPECIALRHMGVAVGGLSCITNLAAGISRTPLSHDEVKETADRVEERFVALLRETVPLVDRIEDVA